MADATTTNVAPPAFQYTPPPDFAGTQAQINSAYTSALAKTQLDRSNLYTNAGFVNGTSDLDQNNQYGGIQQLLHTEGQQLSADDAAETHRGLGLDSGLGAQQAGQIRNTEQLGASNIGTSLLQGVTGDNNSDAEALATKNNATTANQVQSAAYDSQQNAYNDALAQYLKMVQSSQAAAPAVSQAQIAANPLAGQTYKNTGLATETGYNDTLAPKAKPGKVTVNKGASARAL